MGIELDLLRIVRAVIVILALVLTWLAYKGSRKKKSRGLLFMSFGFATIGLSAVLQGVLYEFFGYGIFSVLLLESVVVALGLLLLVYSVYGTTS
jgi:hypothetical protein